MGMIEKRKLKRLEDILGKIGTVPDEETLEKFKALREEREL